MSNVALEQTETVGELRIFVDGEPVGSLTHLEPRWLLLFDALEDFSYFCDEPSQAVEAVVNCRAWGLI